MNVQLWVKRAVVGVAIMAAAMAAAPQVKAEDPPAAVVKVKAFKFEPATIEVAVGTKVTWKNEDKATHGVTVGKWESKPFEPGGTVDYTFDKPGKYPYECFYHPHMKGEIVVK